MSILPHQSAVPGSQFSVLRRLSSVFWLLPLAWLWFVLINDLRVEWTVNPEYSYGWAVPFLCVFLLWQRVRMADDRRENTDIQCPASGFRLPSSGFWLPAAVFCLLAFLYAPTRLVEEANPGWRLVSWTLALETVGLTLIFIRLALGAFPLTSEVRSQKSVAGNQTSVLCPPFSAFVFPICYFLVAVPWPSVVEGTLIQGLTRIDTSLTTELLGWIGIPAMPHGNVIEVATGMVGIDEACSGIRSFQATLMISLFLGEFYSLSILRRTFCVFAGFALSFLFNLARMSLLVWVAARKGIGAIATWHDPAGVTILVACFFSLWGLGVLLKSRKQKVESRNQGREAEGGCTSPRPSPQRGEGGLPSTLNHQLSTLRKLTFALGVWIVLTEVSVEGWYRWHEERVPQAAQWTVAWPTNNPTFKESPLDARTRQILRYDEGKSAGWSDGDLTWNAVFLRWKPGRTAVHLAENHTPNICMTGAGYVLDSITPQEWFEVNGLKMPFSVNKVENTDRPFYVFYCLWDDRASVQGFQTMGLNYGRRLAPVLAGLRNPGQRSLEIAVSGPASAAAAEAVVRAELEKLITSQ
jgi:exosortase/archaeosortase family protein